MGSRPLLQGASSFSEADAGAEYLKMQTLDLHKSTRALGDGGQLSVGLREDLLKAREPGGNEAVRKAHTGVFQAEREEERGGQTWWTQHGASPGAELGSVLPGLTSVARSGILLE